MSNNNNNNSSGGRPAVTESKADLVSIEVSEANSPSFSINGWGRRTRLERLLIVLSGALLLALVAVIVVVACARGSGSSGSESGGPEPITVPAGGLAKSDDVCNTAGCIRAAHGLIQNMDVSVDPCQDFYAYACGGFDKRVRIPDDRTSRSQFSIIDDGLDEQLRDILEANGTETDSPVFKMAREQYKACMDTDRLEQLGLEPLKGILRNLGGWPVLLDGWNDDAFVWHETVQTFRRNGYSTDYLFDFSIATDIRNSTYRTIYFDQASIGLSREYLIKGLENERVKHYYNYMQKVAVLLGADPVRAATELKQSLLFEIKLANASLPREERRNASKLYHPMELQDLSQIAPIVPDWTQYINNILTEDIPVKVTPTERVVVSTPGFLKNLTEILKTEPKRNIANFMMWRAARASLGFMNEAARDIQLEYAKNVTGKKEDTPRWKKCVGSAAGSFSAAVGNLYVQEHFQEDAKGAMMEMVSDIREEFGLILHEIDWMDDTTKAKAFQKLRAIKEYIAYPKEILNTTLLEDLYAGLQINSTHYFQNGISMSIWSTNYHWRRLREKVDKTDWKRHANPAVVNAFYSSIENSIQFPAGILQGTFYDKLRPNYMNYGAIGWVIGHEITHGFDDQGKQYDDVGNLKNWWDPVTEAEYKRKAHCIIWQYGNYTHEGINKSLNGVNTQGENIADNGGLKQAYRAYNRWVDRHGLEPLLPGIDLNQRQLFWLAAANNWCSKYRPKSLELQIKTGVHSPGQFRVMGPFSNSKEFAEDFQCPLGAPMNPVKKCEVW